MKTDAILFFKQFINKSTHAFLALFLLGDNVSYPLKVGRVALVNRQADDLSHLIWMVRAAEDNY